MPIFGLAGLILLTATVWADDAAPNDPDADRVDALLHQSGYTVERRSNDVWLIKQHGDNLGDYKVILATGNNLLVTFVVIARKADIPADADLYYKMLQLNHELDRIKVEIDDDGDADVRSDSSIRVLDVTELKEQVHQVASAADEVYGDIQPYLSSGKDD